MEASRGKIQEPDLHLFAEEGDVQDRRSVIVELKAPPAQLAMNNQTRHRSTRTYKELIPEESQANTRVRADMDQLEHKLCSLGLSQPVRLDLAQAFVVNVTPEQLRKIASLESVDAIRPNHIHYK